MNDNSTARQEPLSAGETQAKAAILAECENLSAAGITFVAVHFDGCGDSGVTEEVQCFDSEYYAYEEQKPAEHDAASLQEHFGTLVPMGYENDCGGFGDVVHHVENTGDEPLRFLEMFRSPRFADLSPNQWMSGTKSLCNNPRGRMAQYCHDRGIEFRFASFAVFIPPWVPSQVRLSTAVEIRRLVEQMAAADKEAWAGVKSTASVRAVKA